MLLTSLTLAALGQASPQSEPPPVSRLIVPRQSVITERAVITRPEIREAEVVEPEYRRGIYWEPPRLSLSLGRLRAVRRPVYAARVAESWEEVAATPAPAASITPPAPALAMPRKSLPPLPAPALAPPPKAAPQADSDRIVDALDRLERRLDRLERQRSEERSEERSTMPPPPPIVPGPPAKEEEQD